MILRLLENFTQLYYLGYVISNSSSAWTGCSAPLGRRCVVTHCERHLHNLPGVPLVCLMTAFILYYYYHYMV